MLSCTRATEEASRFWGCGQILPFIIKPSGDHPDLARPLSLLLHCKNIWVTSTILLSQLHACCVRGTLQTSKDASNLTESLSVVETLLLFVRIFLQKA